MSTIDNVQTATSYDKFGNAVTTGVTNDKLTNDDFLKLMLTELQYQDPTKPMDSKEMMNSQLKMSSIETNLEMATAMKSLEQSFAQTSLSSATNIMGRTVENGTLNDDGTMKSFKVNTVELNDGDVYLNAQEITGIRDMILNPATQAYLNFDSNGQVLDGSGGTLDQFIPLDSAGAVIADSAGKIVVKNAAGDVVTQAEGEEYEYKGSDFVYASETTTISYNDVTKVF
jgi:flagellar basal-body rod modification protein FlgD